MNQEQQRIAIAEACGLFRLMPLRRETRKGKEDPKGVVLFYCEEHHGGAATYAPLPNYLSDLNAMHEAEKTLTTEQRQDYVRCLGWITGGEAIMREFTTTFATAAQRAEAFLRTLSLWTP